MKKSEPDWMLDWRLKAYRHWLTMEEPNWADGALSAHRLPEARSITPLRRPKLKAWTKSIRSCWQTYEKLGIPLQRAGALLASSAMLPLMRCSTAFRSRRRLRNARGEWASSSARFGEAVQEHPELIKKYLGSVVPYSDNYFATLNSAVFTDGSFCYIPKGVKCPMELSTYFRINAKNTGQFERTLIIAEEGASVSYLEGCTAPHAR